VSLRAIPAIGVLALRFAAAIVTGGFVTAWFIVRPGKRPDPALLRLRCTGLTDVGTVLLAGIVTLTPGSTTIDLDLARGELLLHVLDGSDPAAVAADIRRHFERPLRLLFPAGRSSR
jgi:multisubunit Na+/H+ antiporter MnhE subunit